MVQPLPLVAVINNTRLEHGCSHLAVVHFSAPSCVCYLQLIIENFLLLKSPPPQKKGKISNLLPIPSSGESHPKPFQSFL